MAAPSSYPLGEAVFASRILVMISSSVIPALIASKAGMIRCLRTGYAASFTSWKETLKRPSKNAFALAARVSACAALGLAPL